jgi:hypothetical protein
MGEWGIEMNLGWLEELEIFVSFFRGEVSIFNEVFGKNFWKKVRGRFEGAAVGN